MSDLPLPEAPEATVWFLGSTKRYKMVHRPGCRYAKVEYLWAGTCTAEELAEALGDPPRSWHRGCLLCAPDLQAALT